MAKITFDQVVCKGCGLDIHQKLVVATIDGVGIKKGHPQVRHFHKFFDKFKRLVVRKRYYSRSNGEYWCLL